MARESKVKAGTNALVIITLTIVAAFLVNVIGAKGYARFDLTEGNINSLSDATVALINDVEGVEITVYISKDMPDELRDPRQAQSGDEIKKIDLRMITQKFRDVLSEYESQSNGKLTVKFADGDNLVELAKKARLETIAGEEAKATGNVLEFTEYVLGATFHYGEIMERFPLALEPEYFEFEITKRLQRLKEKADASVPMKLVLRQGEKLNKAVDQCGSALRSLVPKDKPGQQDALAMITGEGAKAKIEAVKNGLPKVAETCKAVDVELKAAREAKPGANNGGEPSQPFENLIALANIFDQTFDKLVESLASEDPQVQMQANQLIDQTLMLADSTGSRHDTLVDSPGKKAIGFVCAGGAFCPFPSNKPLIPPELKGALAGKNQFNARIINDLEGLSEQINRQLAGIQQQLFEARGFRLVRVDLDARVPSYVKGLIVLGAREKFSDEQLYVMDQFVMAGGSLVAFINSWDVSIQNWSGNEQMDVTKLVRNESNIGDLLGHFGIRPNVDLVMEPASHDNITLRATVRQGQLAFQAPKAFPYPMLPMVTDFDTEDALVRSVSTLTLPFASSLEISLGGAVKPLIRSTPEAVTTTDPKFPLLPDAQLTRVEGQVNPTPSYLVLAAVANGEFTSYFDGKERAIPTLASDSASGTKVKARGDSAKDGADAANKVVTPDAVHKPSGVGRVLVVGSNMGLEALSVDVILKGFSPALVADNALQHIDKIRGYGANWRNWQTRLGQIEHLIVDQKRKRFGESLQFIFNSLDWSIQNDALVALRSKNLDRRPLRQVTAADHGTYRFLGIALGPIIVVLIGLGMWVIRRRRKTRVARLAGAAKPFGV